MTRAFLEVSDSIEKLDRLAVQVAARRNAIFREIDQHRSSLAQALREKIGTIEDLGFEIVSQKNCNFKKSH